MKRWILVFALGAGLVMGSLSPLHTSAQTTATFKDASATKEALDSKSGDVVKWLEANLTEAQLAALEAAFVVKPDEEMLTVLEQWRATLAGWGYTADHKLCKALDEEIGVIKDKIKDKEKGSK